MQLLPLLGSRKLSMCDPKAEDSGTFSEAALRAMGLWDAIAGRIAFARSAETEIQSIADGEFPLGVAFDTEAAGVRGVKVVGEFPNGTHPPIVYSAALSADARPGSEGFIQYLRSPPSALAFRKAGYDLLPGAVAP